MNRLRHVLQFVGLALLIFGAKLWLIERAGSDLPLLDQWDGEGESVIRPWLEGRLTASNIFSSHNEHRIITTKLYVLGLFVVNGQWNALVETTSNAAIHTLCALVLLLIARRWLAGGWLTVFGGVLLLLFALPFSWENTLYGFQIQFYFLLLFSFGHLVFSLENDRFSIRWSIGQLCGLLAVATMASGFLSAAALLVTLAVQWAHKRALTAQQITTGLIALALCVAGWAMKAAVPDHAVLQAHGIAEFVVSFSHALAWPGPVVVPIVFAPAAVFLIRCIRRRAVAHSEIVLFGLLAWSVLQCAALAYARGGGAVLSSRYFDLLSVNVALGWFFIATQLTGRIRMWSGAVWLCVVTFGLFDVTRTQLESPIPAHAVNRTEQQKWVREYVDTLDRRVFEGLSWPRLPYPAPAVLIERLSSPGIRNVLPPSVRKSASVLSDRLPVTTALPSTLRAASSSLVFNSWPARSTASSWKSSVQPASTLPILRFQVAGDLSPSSDRLRLVVKSAAGEVPVLPEEAPGLRWKTISIARPAGEWWIEASDTDRNGWFAVAGPVELSWFTRVTEKLVKNFAPIAGAGGLLLLVGLGLSVSTAAGPPGTLLADAKRVLARITTRLRHIRDRQRKLFILGGGVIIGAGLCLGWNGGSSTLIPALPSARAGDSTPIGISEWSASSVAAGDLPPSFSAMERRGSFVGRTDAFVGEHITGWYRAAPTTSVMISGYPSSPNHLSLQVQLANGNITSIPFTGPNPGDQWKMWKISLPEDAKAVRVHAIDRVQKFRGWLGFSEPFELSLLHTADVRMIGQTLATIVLTLVLLLGPGIVWHTYRAANFVDVLWPGPLLLAVGGCACWALGGVFTPAAVAVGWVGTTVILLGCFAWCRTDWSAWSNLQVRVLALIVVCVTGAAAKAAFSGGPPGELFDGRISRTLEMGDRPDSRISYHTTQLVAHHLSPYEPEGAKYFQPWDFSGRGPLAGLAAAPIVLATGGQPPLGMPDAPWVPFDHEGFAAYRITMIALAAVSLIAVAGLLLKITDEKRAWLGCVLVALTPFFWHELYFSWPKLISAACTLAAFIAALDRRPAQSAVWLAAGYLFHPLALLSTPFVTSWLLLSHSATLRRRLVEAAIFSACLITFIACWHIVNGLQPSQGGFLQYARAADGIYDVAANVWWRSRWDSFANTFIPFYVLFVNSAHPAFNAIGVQSTAATQYFFQAWTAAPFAVGIVTSAVIGATLVGAIVLEWRVATMTVIGPAAFLLLYWGVTTTGLMREGGHVIFLSTWIFLAWAAGDRIPTWVFGMSFCAVRAVEVYVTLFAPALVSGSWGRLWLLNDLCWLAVSTCCVATAVWLSARFSEPGKLGFGISQSPATKLLSYSGWGSRFTGTLFHNRLMADDVASLVERGTSDDCKRTTSAGRRWRRFA